MKKIFLTVATFLLVAKTFAQAPEKMSYQAVVRNSGNALVTSAPVGMQISILQGSASGASVYTETQTATSNANGLVTIEIGAGTVVSGTFAAIDWSAGPYFIKTETDPTGGSTYTITGTTQLVSTPYALYAKTSGSSTPGPVGPQGPAGNDGATGPQGPQGTAGLDGATGPMGPQGPAGLDGATGPMGPQGPAGLDGATGPMGPQGPAGLDGATGPMGPQGPAGLDGATGPMGPQGPAGLDGATGPTGPAGATGPAGPGVPVGGSAGQVLSKIDATDYNTQWITPAAGGLTGSGTINYHPKFTAATTLGNSLIQDNGTSLSMNIAPSAQYAFYIYKQQLTATGDGQHSLFGYRTRDSQNDGTAYSQAAANSATCGYNFWGDLYTFGVAGWNYNDYSRCGGTFGADVSGIYWGSLGYRSSGLVNYGVYGSSGYASGAGFLPSSELVGIGGGFFGGIVGSMSHGQIIGQINSGELFASYNSGNTYTTGKNVELVGVEGTEKTPVYAVTSVDAVIYSKGNIQLVNGEAHVTFDNNYKNLLGETPVVTVSPNGNCNGLYIASVDKNGFTVKEMNNGTNTVAISWIAVGNRIDNRMEEATRIVTKADFDRNVEQVLFDDGNKDGKASAIWWDGEKIQFGTLPEHLAKVKRSESDRK